MKRCSVQLNVDVHNDLMALAKATGLTASTLTGMMISRWAEKYAGPNTVSGKAYRALKDVADQKIIKGVKK
jgi:hypothetical protein